MSIPRGISARLLQIVPRRMFQVKYVLDEDIVMIWMFKLHEGWYECLIYMRGSFAPAMASRRTIQIV